MSVAAGQEVGMKKGTSILPGHERAGMDPRVAAWLARSMCALSLALAGAGLLLLAANRIYLGVPVFEEWVEDTVIAVGFSTVGAVIAYRFPPRNPIGWLFCAPGLVAAVLLFCGEYAVYAMVAGPWSLPGGEAAAWIVTWLWVVHSGLFAFLGLLFPDGRLPTVRWRYFAWTVVVVVVFGTVTTAFSPGPIDSLSLVSNPLGIEGAPSLHNAVEVFVFALTLVAAGSVLVRLHRADGVERLQIKWFAYSASLLAVGALISWVISDIVDARWLRWDVGFVITVAGLAGLPVALGIAILRYRLHDIDLIVNRALVYAILTAVLAGVFEITLVTVQHLLLVFTHVEDSGLAYFATAMVMAAMFEPLKRRIDVFVEGFFLLKDDGGEEETAL
jgi:hypothetical protein